MYSSVDEGYSRSLADLFQARTGIAVKLVSDTEATKSTGLINRLIAEKERPVADVFWSGDVMRAYTLKHHGIARAGAPETASGVPREFVDPEGFFAGAAARLRVIIYHKPSVADGPQPATVAELAEPRFAAHTCLANPLFGTTSMHAAALFAKWGDERAAKFFDDFARHGGTMLSSNGEVRRRVAAGEFAFGLTDSDDVSVAIRDEKPVGWIVPDQKDGQDGVVVIPCVAVRIAGAPHAENGRKLAEFLASEETERFMAESEAAHFPVRAGVASPEVFGFGLAEVKAMPLDWAALAKKEQELQRGFLKQWVERQQR